MIATVLVSWDFCWFHLSRVCKGHQKRRERASILSTHEDRQNPSEWCYPSFTVSFGLGLLRTSSDQVVKPWLASDVQMTRCLCAFCRLRRRRARRLRSFCRHERMSIRNVVASMSHHGFDHSKYVKRISPDTENHDKNGYAKLYDDKNIIMTNVDNSDTTYTNAQEHKVQRARHG